MKQDLEQVLTDIQFIIKKHFYTKQETSDRILIKISNMVDEVLDEINESRKSHIIDIHLIDENDNDIESDSCYEIINKKLLKNGEEIFDFREDAIDYDKIAKIIMENETDILASIDLDNKEVWTNDF